MMQRNCGIVGLLLLMILIAAIPSGQMMAQDATATPQAGLPEFGMFVASDSPERYFQVEMTPGSSTELTAGIRNTGDVHVVLRTYATNAFNPANGGFAAGMEDDEAVGPALWIEFEAISFEMAPGERREQSFTVTVPEGTAPGVYVAAVVVSTVETLEIPGSENFRQILRSALPVEIIVPGPENPGFELGEPEFSIETAQTMLQVPVTNTGNMRLSPQGELVVTAIDGTQVIRSTVEMETVFVGSETMVQVGVPEQVLPGDYLVSIDLTDEEFEVRDAFSEVLINLPERPEPVRATPEPAPLFEVSDVTIAPSGDPVQYADVDATIINNGSNIPTANVMLNVQRDGEDVESYPLAQNQALPRGETAFSQRYIPVDGWEAGTYSFHLVIVSVSGGTETTLSTIDVEETIEVP